MKLLVTGGLGFVGTNFADFASARHAIRIFDNGSAGDPQPPVLRDGIEIVRGDVRDAGAVRDAAKGIDAILHLAAQTGVVESLDDPRTSVDINVDGTLNVLEAARAAGVSRVVIASSNAAVGDQEPPMDEQKVARPISPYGATKLAGEALCSAFTAAYGLETIALRFSNLYGPWSVHKGSVVASFFRAALAGKPLIVHGDGRQTRDFLFTDDLNRGLETALSHPSARGVYQIASGTETAIGELAAAVKRLVDADSLGPVRLEYVGSRVGDVARNYSSINKIAAEMGFSPVVPLDEGLKRTWAWFRARQVAPHGSK